MEREFLNCLSSREWGLGTCACVNHPPYVTREIKFERAIELLMEKDPEAVEVEGDAERGEIRIKVIFKTRENLYGDKIEDDTLYITISRR